MKLDHNKHYIEQFAYYLKFLGEMIEMSDEEVLAHFKETILPTIEAQLLQINNNGTFIGKARILALLVKPSNLAFHNLLVLGHMTHKNDNAALSEVPNMTEPNTLCKTEINPQGLTVTSEPSGNMTIIQQNTQQQPRCIFAARKSNNYRGLIRGRIPKYAPNSKRLGLPNNMHTGNELQNDSSISDNEFSRQNGNFRHRSNRFL